MSSEHINWSSFKLRININRSSKEIYDCWTSQQGLENWFLREAIFKYAANSGLKIPPSRKAIRMNGAGMAILMK